MKNAIPNFLKIASSFDDPILKWEFVKYKCRDLSRQISIEKSRERKSRHVKLENGLAELDNIIATNSSEEVITAYYNCKSDLEALYNYITEGIIMRSKLSSNIQRWPQTYSYRITFGGGFFFLIFFVNGPPAMKLVIFINFL